MKFTDLVFDQTGCCGTHVWAVARHESGVRTEVYREEAGYSAATFGGNALLRGREMLADEAAVDARLDDDSQIRS